MRIATLNIRHGGGRRGRKLLEHIDRMDPDILVLSEFRNDSTGSLLRHSLLERGFAHQQAPETGLKTNTVLIAARHEFESVLFEDELGENRHRCVKAAFGVFDVYGLYFPNQQAKQPVFDFLNSFNDEVLQSSSLLIGDFNTGRHFEDEPGKTFFCASDFDQLLERGWIDAWRSRHPEAREFSWYSNAGNGFRLDQAIASPTFDEMISSVGYDHAPRKEKATDHSALVIDL